MDPTLSEDAPPRATGDAYLDTIALLQEEIHRLEAELHSRDLEAFGAGPEIVEFPVEPEAARRVAELTALLGDRDAAIEQLWEELSAIEEAQAARIAEWDQLHRWVEALEQRLAEGDGHPGDPDAARREAEALRDQLEARGRAWDEHRRRLEDEVAGLRARLDEATAGASPPDVAALEDENRRLRDECRRLALVEAEAGDPAGIAELARELRAELDEAARRLAAAEDDLRAERLRHQAELAAARAQQAPGRAADGAPPPHERIRAFREHLRELHAREEQERQERQLSGRLSRLWHRSGPRR